MNKRQKLVQEQFLNNEEAVMELLKSTYTKSRQGIEKEVKKLQKQIETLEAQYKILEDYLSDDEKDQLLSMQRSKVYQKEYQEALKKQVSDILDTMHQESYETVSEYLQKCYEDSFVGTMYDLHGQGIPLIFPIDQEAVVRAVQLDSKISKGLYKRLGEDVAQLKKNIAAEVSRGISTGASYSQIALQIKARMTGIYDKKSGGALYRAETIARTEGHRIQIQSGMDACYKAQDSGADVVKQWDSTLDGDTRPSHRKVDGEIRELDEPFSNGLMFPGDPAGGAKEVINCRCALLQRARWALDEDELKTLQNRAKYFKLDKADSFADFKKKYLKAADDDIILTRDDIKQRIKDNKQRIRDIDEDVMKIDRNINRHNSHDYDDMKGLNKSTISGKMKQIEERLAEIEPISHKYYNRPERGTDEYYEWREWRRGIDFFAIQEEQMKLAQEHADLSGMLRKWDRYEEWLQWKKDNPLGVLNKNKKALADEIKKLQKEIEDYKKRLSEMAIPKDWTQIKGDHDSAFDIAAANPNYSKGREYRVNCQRCVPTYEMRRRGYDVEAKPNLDWDTGDYLSRHSSEVFENAEVHWNLAGTGKRDIERLLKEWGDGARAEVGVSWKGARSGHVFVAENVGGKIVYIDPQSGNMDVSDYFKRVRSNETRVWRIDNLNPSEYIADCCEKKVSK